MRSQRGDRSGGMTTGGVGLMTQDMEGTTKGAKFFSFHEEMRSGTQVQEKKDLSKAGEAEASRPRFYL